jgi:hypothetical protein
MRERKYATSADITDSLIRDCRPHTRNIGPGRGHLLPTSETGQGGPEPASWLSYLQRYAGNGAVARLMGNAVVDLQRNCDPAPIGNHGAQYINPPPSTCPGFQAIYNELWAKRQGTPKSGSNWAALAYRKGEQIGVLGPHENLKYHEGGGHSEEWLLGVWNATLKGTGAKPMALFTERSPCSSCEPLVGQLAQQTTGPFFVYYLVGYSTGPAATSYNSEQAATLIGDYWSRGIK